MTSFILIPLTLFLMLCLIGAVSSHKSMKGTESDTVSTVSIVVLSASIALCIYFLIPERLNGDNSISAEASMFDTFTAETSAINDILDCKNSGITSTPGLPDLWGCSHPVAEVVKVYVNGGESDGVENVKLMWDDYTKDVGYGLHADREVAELWLASLLSRYASDAVDRMTEAFNGSEDVRVNVDGIAVEYTYSQGPAIGERLITITSGR